MNRSCIPYNNQVCSISQLGVCCPIMEPLGNVSSVARELTLESKSHTLSCASVYSWDSGGGGVRGKRGRENEIRGTYTSCLMESSKEEKQRKHFGSSPSFFSCLFFFLGPLHHPPFSGYLGTLPPSPKLLWAQVCEGGRASNCPISCWALWPAANAWGWRCPATVAGGTSS